MVAARAYEYPNDSRTMRETRVQVLVIQHVKGMEEKREKRRSQVDVATCSHFNQGEGEGERERERQTDRKRERGRPAKRAYWKKMAQHGSLRKSKGEKANRRGGSALKGGSGISSKKGHAKGAITKKGVRSPSCRRNICMEHDGDLCVCVNHFRGCLLTICFIFTCSIIREI